MRVHRDYLILKYAGLEISVYLVDIDSVFVAYATLAFFSSVLMHSGNCGTKAQDTGNHGIIQDIYVMLCATLIFSSIN